MLEQRSRHFPGVPVEAIRGQLLLLAGWSARRSRLCGVIFNQSPVAEGFQRTPLAGFTDDEDPRGRRFAAPWNMQKRGPLPYATTPEAMEQIARAQMDDFGGVAAGRGGRLLVAELTRDAVSVRSQCDLEDEPATKLKVEPRAEPGPPAVSKGRISNVTPPTVAAPRQTGAGHAVVFGRW